MKKTIKRRQRRERTVLVTIFGLSRGEAGGNANKSTGDEFFDFLFRILSAPSVSAQSNQNSRHRSVQEQITNKSLAHRLTSGSLTSTNSGGGDKKPSSDRADIDWDSTSKLKLKQPELSKKELSRSYESSEKKNKELKKKDKSRYGEEEGKKKRKSKLKEWLLKKSWRRLRNLG